MTRRLLQRLLTLSATLALVVCVAAVVLWVRSYRLADAVGWSWETGAVQGGTASGRLRLGGHGLPEGQRYAPPHLIHISYPPAIDPPTRRLPATWSNLGFAFERTRDPASVMLLAPLWAVVVAAFGLAVGSYRASRRLLRAGRRAAGRCAVCGYNLTGNLSGICPECGTPAPLKWLSGAAADGRGRCTPSAGHGYRRCTLHLVVEREMPGTSTTQVG